MATLANDGTVLVWIGFGLFALWVWRSIRLVTKEPREDASSSPTDPVESVTRTTPPAKPVESQELEASCTAEPLPQQAKEASVPEVTTPLDLAAAAASRETDPAMLRNHKVREAIDLINRGESLFVCGNAGTGKSTLLRYISETNRNVCVVAPTAVAAINAGGVTIHSLLKLPPRLIQPKDIKKLRNTSVVRKLDILLIDEISMVRADLMDAIHRSLQVNRMSSAPFGGVQIVCFGDMAQLPPIVGSDDLEKYFHDHYGSSFFFEAKVFDQIKLRAVELTENYRQEDLEFVSLLNEIRNGDKTGGGIRRLNRQVNGHFDPVTDAETVVLTPTRARATDINDRCIRHLPDEPSVFEATLTGKFPRQSLPVDTELFLKRGAKVMMAKNDPQKRWHNGTVGTVVDLDENKRFVKVKIGSKVWDVFPVTWEQIDYQYCERTKQIGWSVVGTFTQLPVQVAYALTIHKAQGKTIERICIDTSAGGAFAHGQMYVALSRCRKLHRLTLTYPLYPEDIIVDPRAFGYRDRFSMME